MEAKLELARFIVRRSHGEEAAARPRLISPGSCGGGRARDVRSTRCPTATRCTCRADRAAFGLSTSEARRMIAQGGVKLDGAAIEASDVSREALEGSLLQVGKSRFAR